MARTKESSQLHRISGAWVERGHEEFTRVAIKCEYDLSKVTPRVKTAIIKALRTGVIGTHRGMAANVFGVVSEAYGLKYVLASNRGRYFYSNFSIDSFYESIVAVMSLQDNWKNRDVQHYINKYNNRITSWQWGGGATIVREIYANVIGYPDKELREEAIDFFSEGGKLVHTWVDKNPR